MISKNEYEKLKVAKEDGYEWVAKDASGWVFAYTTKPKKRSGFWFFNGSVRVVSVEGLTFDVLSRDDEEPRKIDELIEEYERHINRESSAKGATETTLKWNPQHLVGSKIEFDNPAHSPSHYKQGHIETIDKIKLLLTPEEYLGYLKGNIIKYGDRAPFKGSAEQDYDKQKVYYDWVLKELEG